MRLERGWEWWLSVSGESKALMCDLRRIERRSLLCNGASRTVVSRWWRTNVSGEGEMYHISGHIFSFVLAWEYGKIRHSWTVNEHPGLVVRPDSEAVAYSSILRGIASRFQNLASSGEVAPRKRVAISTQSQLHTCCQVETRRDATLVRLHREVRVICDRGVASRYINPLKP